MRAGRPVSDRCVRRAYGPGGYKLRGLSPEQIEPAPHHGGAGGGAAGQVILDPVVPEPVGATLVRAHPRPDLARPVPVLPAMNFGLGEVA